MLTRLTVTRNERVALVLDGQFERLYRPGVHWVWTGSALAEWQRYDLSTRVAERVVHGDVLPRDLPETELVSVAPGQRLVVLVNGVLHQVLGVGTWRIWKLGFIEQHLVEVEAQPQPLTETDPLRDRELGKHARELEAGEGLAVLVLRDGEPVEALTEGRLRTWTGSRWSTRHLDLRLQVLELSAQELLTADQVGVRVKPVVTWQVTEALRFARQAGASALLYTAVQLALREVVASLTLEQLLGDKAALSTALSEAARAQLPELGLRIEQANVKDVVLPGEVKEILKKVTVARKEAEAQAIRRREEVAQTRQLLNTAKLLESNPTLLRLKEMEQLAAIAGQVGELKLVLGSEELDRFGLRK